MESTQLVLNAISTVGFPIVVCLIMIWMVYKQNQSHVDESGPPKRAAEAAKSVRLTSAPTPRPNLL